MSMVLNIQTFFEKYLYFKKLGVYERSVVHF